MTVASVKKRLFRQQVFQHEKRLIFQGFFRFSTLFCSNNNNKNIVRFLIEDREFFEEEYP